MTEETTLTMKPEEAIIEIRTIQIKHNQEIKSLQDYQKSVQEKFQTESMKQMKKWKKNSKLSIIKLPDKLPQQTTKSIQS